MVSQETLNVIVNLIVLIGAVCAVTLVVWPMNTDRVRWTAGVIAIMTVSALIVQFYWVDLSDDAVPLDEGGLLYAT